MTPTSSPDLSNAPIAAPALLGWKLLHQTEAGLTSGYIVETEAYLPDDPASHAFRGPGKANAPLFAEAGTIYVYFTYGKHYCVNLATGPAGNGQGVLIRALEPVEGIGLMQRRRGQERLEQLCSGPAKLVQAMAITKDLSGQPLAHGQLWLEPGFVPDAIRRTPRIGISQATDKLWRFVIAGNRFASKPVA